METTALLITNKPRRHSNIVHFDVLKCR
jgi:hypothetical protein